MSQEFRYSLTRICLRTGQLSLSQGMAQLFPESGRVQAVDTVEDDELELTVVAPRRIAGLEEYFRRHDLQVNDSIRLRKLPEGNVALTAIPRPRSARAGEQSDAPPVLKPEPEQRTPARPKRPEADRTQPRTAAVTPYPRGVLFPGEAGLNSKRPQADGESLNRARRALSDFGLEVEGQPHSRLLANADLGRRRYGVLVRVLGTGDRLDWAELLAQRRKESAAYLSIFGDHRDLHRLTAPAELAGATLWSWEGIARVQNLSQRIPIGPIELEPHFAKSGMFEVGLEQFEESVADLLAERGALSEVLARLALLRAPGVFVLDDLLYDPSPASPASEETVATGSGRVEAVEPSRDQMVRQLELLQQPPFQLVGRVDDGEYFLRHPVSEALARLSQYAVSLSDSLPLAKRVRLEGSSARQDGETEQMAKTRSDESVKEQV